MLKNCSVVGHGTMRVVRDGVERVVANSNAILDNFYSWVAAANTVDGVAPSCKVGKGTSPTVLDMTQLETPIIPLIGEYPTHTKVQGLAAVYINGGQQIRTSCTFSYTFTKGAIQDEITEYGLDFSGSPIGGNINTRVLTTENQRVNKVILTEEDTLFIDYTITLDLDVNIPPTTLEIGRPTGSTTHQVYFGWGELTYFSRYLAIFGQPDTTREYLLGHVSAKPPNPITDEQMDALITRTRGINGSPPTLDGLTNEWVKSFRLATSVGNEPEGNNLLLPGSSNNLMRNICYWYITPSIIKTPTQVLTFSLRK